MLTSNYYKIDRTVLFSFVLLFSLQGTAQIGKASFYASLSGYRNTGFESNLFTEAQLGVALWSDKIISPEVGIGYAGSSPQDIMRVFEENDIETEQQIKSRSRAFLMSAGVNVRLTKRESHWITAFSKINYLPSVSFTSRLFEGTTVNNVSLQETITSTATATFFDFGLGIEGFLNEKETWSGSLSLVYTTNNVFDSFRDLDVNSSQVSINFPSNGGIGLRFLGRFHL